MALTQERRRIAIETPLGKDALLLTSVDGIEDISRLFTYRLGMVSENDSIAPPDIIGQNVTIALIDPDDEPRFVNGHVRWFINQGHGDRATCYTAEVVPWLWFLTRRTDCRIFQDRTVPQIIEDVFRNLGFADFDLSGLTGSYDELDYCVQYRETDFDFVSRLMEREGIFYFFKHENGKHTLMLGDHPSAYQTCKNDKVRFLGPLSFDEVDDDITAWEHRYEFRSGRVANADFNFEKPQEPVRAHEKTVLRVPGAERFELYDYPGVHYEPGAADRRARLRMEQEEAPYDLVIGASKCRNFGPGYMFTVAEHHQAGERGRRYVITSVRHQANAGAFVSGGRQPEGYSNQFECIPADVTFRPAAVTPKGLVRGPQTAVVVGPAGEEIYTDEYGRVKVQFHWDRYGKKNEKSSCWIRVSQPWAGKGFGGMAIPRIGQEVIVDFEEGDPDRPIITGRVYNADLMQSGELPASEAASPTGKKPIPEMQGRASGLPAAKARTTMKSNSTPGGGGANEIAFDDAKGGELFFVNATKDAVRTVGNNDRTSVGADQELSVAANQNEFVGANRDRHVAANETIHIGANQTENVVANRSTTIGANDTESVGANQTSTVALMRTTSVGINDMLNVGAAQEVTVGAAQAVTVGAVQTNTIGASQNNAIGSNRSTAVGGNDALTVAKKLSIQAGSEILIQTGKATIHLKKDGTILIKGKDITVEGSGKINVKASKDIVMKGKKILQN